MKKNYYLVLLVVLLSVSVKAQTNWVDVKLDEKLAIKFPSEPEKKIGNGSASYVSKTKDSVKYSVGILDYKVIAHKDSADLERIKDAPAFAGQLKHDIVSQKQNYTFGDITTGKWKTFNTYSILGVKSADGGKIAIKMILIGSKMYFLSCLVPAELITKDSEVFFSSVELIKP